MRVDVLFILSVNFDCTDRCALIYFPSPQNVFPSKSQSEILRTLQRCWDDYKASKGMSACTLQTSKYWIIKCRVSRCSFQLSACRLSRPIRTFLACLKESTVARRVTPKLHVCAETRAPSQLIACDSSQSPGRWSIITLWSEWMSALTCRLKAVRKQNIRW